MDIDIFVADIITNELGINANRVVVYGQNFKAPNDDNLYVIVKTGATIILGSVNRFDESTLEEVKSITSFVTLTIELTSKNREAYEKKEEVVMALTSVYSIQKQEENSFKLFRAGDIQDLTFIEGAASLYRFNIPVKANYLTIKRTEVPYFDKKRANEIIVERK